MKWRYYFPGDGEAADDARALDRLTLEPLDHEDAAQIACERDWSRHDGFERGETEFEIAIISPDGEEQRFSAWHEPSVEHRVSQK